MPSENKNVFIQRMQRYIFYGIYHFATTAGVLTFKIFFCNTLIYNDIFVFLIKFDFGNFAPKNVKLWLKVSMFFLNYWIL